MDFKVFESKVTKQIKLYGEDWYGLKMLCKQNLEMSRDECVVVIYSAFQKLGWSLTIKNVNEKLK